MSNGTIIAIAVVVVVLIVALVVLAVVLQQHKSSTGPATSSTNSLSLVLNVSSSNSTTESKPQAVYGLGESLIVYNSTTGQVTIYVVLHNPNSFDLRIAGVAINNVPLVINGSQYTVLPPGTFTLTISGTSASQIPLQAGEMVTIEISLNDGQTVMVPAVVQYG